MVLLKYDIIYFSFEKGLSAETDVTASLTHTSLFLWHNFKIEEEVINSMGCYQYIRLVIRILLLLIKILAKCRQLKK